MTNYNKKTSKAGRAYIAKKVSKNIKEGKDFGQSVAIAISQAKHKGFRVPAPKKMPKPRR